MGIKSRNLAILLCLLASHALGKSDAARIDPVERRFPKYWGKKHGTIPSLNNNWSGYIYKYGDTKYCFVIKVANDGSFVRFRNDGYDEKISLYNPLMDNWNFDSDPSISLTFDGSNTPFSTEVESWEVGDYEVRTVPGMFEAVQKSSILALKKTPGHFTFLDVTGSKQALKALSDCKFRVI